jgi:Ca2+-binding RTX toxin-like protein
VPTGGLTDSFSYRVKDQLGDLSNTITTTVALDPGPMAGNAQLDLAPGQTVDLTSALMALDTPGLPGDSLSLSAVGTPTGTPHGTTALSNGDLKYTAPASGTSDSFTYTIADQLDETASGTVNVTLNQALTGNGSFTFSGNNNIVSLGNGNDPVSLTGNNNTVLLGNGNDTVSLTGNNNTVLLGNGNDTVTVSGTGDSVTAGTGSDVFNLGASMMTTLTMHGLHETVSINGGADTIVDTPKGADKLQLQIGAQGGTVGITNFGVANAVVSLVQALASGLG